MPRPRTDRGQQEQRGALEWAADLAAVGAKLVDNVVVEGIPVWLLFGHVWSSSLGRASIPDSLRCWTVMGAGASVSGSTPPPVLGNAITSRIESLPANRA